MLPWAKSRVRVVRCERSVRHCEERLARRGNPDSFHSAVRFLFLPLFWFATAYGLAMTARDHREPDG
jgi:hypothetical protein